MTGAALALPVVKELRSLLPIWAACTALLIGAHLFDIPFGRAYLVLLYGFGSIALGAHLFGQEFANGTFVLLLTQPMERRRVLAIKLGVLAAMLAAIGAAAWLTLPRAASDDFAWTAVLVGAVALCLAPAWTLVARSTLAGAVFTIATPAVVRLGLDIVGAVRFDREPDRMDAFQDQVFGPVLLIVCGVAASLTMRRFSRIEADGSTGGDIHLFTRAGRKSRETFERPNAMWQLIAKELRVQQMTLTVTAIFAAAFVLQAVILQLYPGSPTGHILPIAVLHGLAGTLLAGSLSSAEERHLGTWHSQSMLPLAPARLWMVKVAVAYALVIVLAGGLSAAAAALAPGTRPMWTRIGPLAAVLVVTTLAIYVSSVSKSGIRALLAVVLVLFGAVPLGMTLLSEVPRLLGPIVELRAAGPLGRGGIPGAQSLLGTAMVFCAGALWMGYRNHLAGEHRKVAIAGQAAVLTALVLTGVIASFITGL